MKKFRVHENRTKQTLTKITLSLMLLSSILLVYIGFTSALGIEVFSEKEQPFGIPYNEWIVKYWNWAIALTPEQSDPPNGSCPINKSGSMVILLDPANGEKREFDCDISSKDGIMIPSWGGVFENNNKDQLPDDTPVEQLSNITKYALDLGTVTSEVKVDDKLVGQLDEITTNETGTKTNIMHNFTEIYAKPFNLTIPNDPSVPDQIAGTWPAGAHGWFTFLKPLPPGDHKVYYGLNVQPLTKDEAGVSAEYTYTFHVK